MSLGYVEGPFKPMVRNELGEEVDKLGVDHDLLRRISDEHISWEVELGWASWFLLRSSPCGVDCLTS